MLSAPGLGLHRARPPFLQLVVGPAHPAVERVVGYTSFLLWFSCHLVEIFIYLFFFVVVVLRVPLLTFGPPGRFLCRGDTRRGK